MRLGDILLAAQKIDAKQLEDALAAQRNVPGKRLGTLLVERGFVTESELAEALAEQLEIPVLHPLELEIEPAVLRMIPYEDALASRVIPVSRVNNDLTVAMADPLDIRLSDRIASRTGCRVRYAVAPESEILEAVKEFYGQVDGGVMGEEGTAIVQAERFALEEEQLSTDILRKEMEQKPIIRVTTHILNRSVEKRATDIHIEPTRRDTIVRIRVDGMLQQLTSVRRSYHRALISRIKIMADLDIAETRRPQDGRVFITVGGQPIDLRISSLPSQHGEKIVLRVLEKGHKGASLTTLGFEEDDLEKFNYMIFRPQGLILVTGPTGSGKTTTLYAALQRIRSVEKNIVTIEDPIEYEVEQVTQTQVNEKVGVTFSSQLRSVLRQDPDIILVGEIRDSETVEQAIRASLTGHLVFSTLHTNDAPSAIIRLREMGVPAYLIPSSLSGVLAQRLVRLVCPDCKETYQPDPAILAQLYSICPDVEGASFIRGAGCMTCGGSGYRGRSAIFEVIRMSDALSAATLDSAPAAELKRVAVREGMVSLQERAGQKLLAGSTTPEEVIRVASF